MHSQLGWLCRQIVICSWEYCDLCCGFHANKQEALLLEQSMYILRRAVSHCLIKLVYFLFVSQQNCRCSPPQHRDPQGVTSLAGAEMVFLTGQRLSWLCGGSLESFGTFWSHSLPWTLMTCLWVFCLVVVHFFLFWGFWKYLWCDGFYVIILLVKEKLRMVTFRTQGHFPSWSARARLLRSPETSSSQW